MFRDASCEFVDRALTIERKSFEMTHYSAFLCGCFETLCAYFALFAVARLVYREGREERAKKANGRKLTCVLRYTSAFSKGNSLAKNALRSGKPLTPPLMTLVILTISSRSAATFKLPSVHS